MLRLKRPGRTHLGVGIPLIAMLCFALVAVLLLGARARKRLREHGQLRFRAVGAETTLVGWRQRMLQRVDRLERGYLEYRNRDVAYTEEQVELARSADSGFLAVRDSLTYWPEVESYECRILRARRIKRMVSKLRKPMGRFKRRMRAADSIAQLRAQAEQMPCLTAE